MATQSKPEKLTKATMKRPKGFDYRKPYFYMVTLKRVKGLAQFCEITKEKVPPKDTQGRPRYLVANTITETFAQVIQGFHERWHPGRQYEKYCAEGRMLYLSPFPVPDRLPTKSELYQRCHETGNIVAEG